MIAPGRDALVRATVLRWLRRVASPPIPSDDPLATRLDNAESPPSPYPGGGTTWPSGPAGGGGTEPEPPPTSPPTVPGSPGNPAPTTPGGEPPGPPGPPSVPGGTSIPEPQPGSGGEEPGTVASSAFMRSQVSSTLPEFSSILAFGGTSDWTSTRGTATYTPQQATAATIDTPPVALLQVLSATVFTDARISVEYQGTDTGLWLRVRTNGALYSGYCAEYTPGDGRLTLYGVIDSVFTALALDLVAPAVGARLYLQASGSNLTAGIEGGDSITVFDEEHAQGQIGFGAQAQNVGDPYVALQVTPPR